MMCDLQDRLLSKDDVPRVFHDVGGDLIGEVIVHHPIVHTLVVRVGTLENLLLGDSKLRTTRSGNLSGDSLAREKRFPGLRVVSLAGVLQLRGLAEGLNGIGAAGAKLTTEIDETLELDKVLLQGAHGIHVTEIHCIDVPAGGPAVTVGMQEDRHFGEVVIMVDQELEVWEGFAALVLGGVHGGSGIVNGVDNSVPSEIGVSAIITQSSDQSLTRPILPTPRR